MRMNRSGGGSVSSSARRGACSVIPGRRWSQRPGDRVVFFDDFSADTVGDFPRRFELAAGNWEVVEWQGRRFLRATSNGAVGIALPENLPERFTIEFPASVQHGNANI